jgi:DNA-binding response OmpR family regulator
MGEIPIIALTAHATSEDRVAAYEAGVSDYEQKPVDIAKLLSRIDDLLKN